jgi:hypothetical protein
VGAEAVVAVCPESVAQRIRRVQATADAPSRNGSLGDVALLVVFCCWKCSGGGVHKPMGGSTILQKGGGRLQSAQRARAGARLPS